MPPTLSISALLVANLGALMPLALGQTLDIPSLYTVDNAHKHFHRENFVATEQNQTALLVENGGRLTLTSCSISKTGNTSDIEDSFFSNLNSAVAVQLNGTLVMHDTSISTDGDSANAVHLYEDGSRAYIYQSFISAFDYMSHGLYLAGGYLYAEDTIVTTFGMYSGAISTDKGGGTTVLKNCKAHTLGELSACLYSTGTIIVEGLDCVAEIGFGGVIDSNNSISIADSQISSGPLQFGVFRLFSSMTSLPESPSYINISRTTVEETLGLNGVFSVSNVHAIVRLDEVTINAESGLIINSTVADTGTKGDNGGIAEVYMTDMDVTGDYACSEISSLELNLSNTKLKGAINAANTGGQVDISLDGKSRWVVTADSYLSSLTYQKKSQIVKNGNKVYVNNKAI